VSEGGGGARVPPLVGGAAPAARHPALAACLAERYDEQALERVARQLQALSLTTLPCLPNGLYAANPAPAEAVAYTGYGRTWVRDTVQVTAAAWELGDVDSVARSCASLVRFYQLQAPRFEAAIAGTSDLDDPMQRPHVRFDGRAIAELDEPWPHIQNDAHGYALWLLARAALSGLLPLDETCAGVLARFGPYFAAIDYSQDRDSGHWEEQRRRSSASIGTVLAGLTALRGLCRSQDAVRPGRAASLSGGQDLDALIAAGRAVLDASLPWETRDARASGRDRQADASLLFLVYPLRVVSGDQADAILQLVAEQLVGPFGVRRYQGDSYWCAGYAQMFDEQTRTSGFFDNVDARDAQLRPGSEAQWCLFDPLLSSIYGWRYVASRDERDRALQTAHFNRALSQVTGPECRLGPGLCPESYYVPDPQLPERRVVNDATPLLWTQALLLVSLQGMQRSVSLPGA